MKNFIFIGLWPGSARSSCCSSSSRIEASLSTPIVIVIGLGALVIGVIPVIVFYRKGKAYYGRRPLELPEDLMTSQIAINSNDPRVG